MAIEASKIVEDSTEPDPVALKARAAEWTERKEAVAFVRAALKGPLAHGERERLVGFLLDLAGDAKWEIRKAAAEGLAETAHPSARTVVERLLEDENVWVRQAAKLARRRLARITTPGGKRDPIRQLAFDRLKSLGDLTHEKVYDLALEIGERHYEELARDTTHELNTVWTTMEEDLRELERAATGGAPADEIREILNRLRSQSSRVRRFLRELREYAQTGELRFTVEPLGSLVEEAVENAQEKARARIGERPVAIRADVGSVTVEVCRDRFIRALANVVSNSIESFEKKPDGGTVEVSAVSEADRVTLTVHDDGCGLPADETENAKRRLTSLKKYGLGFGLPMAVKIIEHEHGGRLEMDSRLHAGTTVRIEIPMRRSVSA